MKSGKGDGGGGHPGSGTHKPRLNGVFTNER